MLNIENIPQANNLISPEC